MNRINPETTVGELVAQQPARSRVFESLKIDYCCGGKLPLVQACANRGLDTGTVIGLLEQVNGESADVVDADAMSLTDLADHIVHAHHDFLREELPRLDAITERVYRVHGEREPRLKQVREAFCELKDEMLSHMGKEEHVLFPMIRKMEQTGKAQSCCGGTLAHPIRQMEAEHAQSGDQLAVMSAATDGYTPPQWACNTYRAMLDGLANLERDMHQHVHKENNVLFPKALALESKLTGAVAGGSDAGCCCGG
ncbi:MAG: iron-sulfur cluster repair di-iron protein [Leptolyngbya sp. PLA3]|nr:MAG: iron-sulfur cluster repair di-iron protein [Cyanobacteria bacterium CYA]MCE7967484.1 iron-sulfur cluster repair di-iron protein [Leptolyngbya sp. PL-A3]